ncbi:MAG: hypothetical protein IPK26_29045 [Planctomycetes bacterium]|nr:hypothetical protein [Planctomycetota bacterium]
MQAKNNWILAVAASAAVLATRGFAQETAPATPGQGPGQGEIRSDAEGDRSSRLTLKLKDRDLRDVVATIKRKASVNIIMDPAIEETVTLELQDVAWRQALDLVAEQAGCIVSEAAGGVLKIEKPPRVYFAFENTDIAKVIDTIAKISGANIVVSPEVKGNITLRLKHIPWRDALDAAVKTLGFEVVTEPRGILRVVSAANIRQDLEFATIQLRYVRPQSTYMPFMESEYIENKRAKAPLQKGEVNFTLLDTLKSGWSASMGLGSIPHRLPFDLGGGGWEDSIIANPAGRGPFATEAENDPAGTTIPNVVFGALDFTQVTATLRLLKKDTRSEILQAPKIVALDHQTSTIFVGEAVRYAQARVEQGQAGGLLLALEEGDESPVNIGFQLLTTPHLIPGTDKVILEVIPQRTALTGTGSTSLAPAGFDVFRVGTGGEEGQIALPRVASSTLATKVLLRSGQTAVLGGLVTRTQTESEVKLPLLGDIPVLGYLFKNRTTQDSRTTLIVFITPSIVRSAEDTKDTINRVLEEKLRMRRGLMEQQDAVFGRGESK